MLTFTLHHYCPLPDPLESVATAGLASARLLSWSLHSAWNAHPSLAWLAFFPSNSAGIRFPAASVPGYRSTDIHNDVWHALIHSRTMTLWIWGHEYGQGTVMQNGHSLCELCENNSSFLCQKKKKKVSVCLIHLLVRHAHISFCQSWHDTTQISQLTHGANKAIIRLWHSLVQQVCSRCL